MRDELRRIHTLLLKHESWSAAGLVGELLDSYGADEDRFWRDIDSVNVWGGAGSLADQGLVVDRSPALADLEMDRKTFWRAMVAIESEMRAQGLKNQRAANWAAAFSQWVSPRA